MVQTIEVEVGDLYAGIHEQYQESLGDEYEDIVRENVEQMLHNLNQKIERQQEASLAGDDIEVEE